MHFEAKLPDSDKILVTGSTGLLGVFAASHTGLLCRISCRRDTGAMAAWRGAVQRVNVGGTQNGVDAALAQGVERFIYASAFDVFAGGAGHELNESQLDPQPRGTIYERYKQAADQLAVTAMHHGQPAVFLHPADVYAPGPSRSPGINATIAQLHLGWLPALHPAVVRLIASTGEWMSQYTLRPSLLAKGAWCFLQWQAIFRSEKA